MIRLAHVLNLSGATGGSQQATTLLDTWGEYDDLEPWGVQATNLGSPENFVSEPNEDRDYPIMYPKNIQDGLREIDPDVTLVHGFSPKLNRQLRELSEDRSFEGTFALRNGMNLYEHWGMALKHQNHEKLTHQVTELDWYDLIVCPTQAVVERTQLMYGERCPELTYIPNGIKRDDYVPSSFMLDDELKVVLASRGGPNDFLLAPMIAVARILGDGDIPMSLEVFGACHPTLSTALHEIAGAYDDIDIRGFVDHSAIRSRMETADVVCVPSVSQQAVPLVAVEGLAAGNVVICGDFHEANEESALIQVPVAHPPAWHDALTDVYDDPDDAREWIRTGIERAADYEVHRIIEEGYLPAFRDLVDDEVR